MIRLNLFIAQVKVLFASIQIQPNQEDYNILTYMRISSLDSRLIFF